MESVQLADSGSEFVHLGKNDKKKAVEISTALGQQIDGFQLINKYDTE